MARKLKDLIREAREALHEDGGVPLGTVHKWHNGKQYQKTRDGWVEVPTGRPSSSSGSTIKALPSEGGTSATTDSLPEAPHRYFHIDKDTKVIPVASLKTIRARPTGIENASKHMANAYNGVGGKRKPIHVRDNGDGSYTVLDGNSTTAIAKKHNWKEIPVTVIPDAKVARTSPTVKHPEEFDAVLDQLRPVISAGKLKKDMTLDEHVHVAEKFLAKHSAVLEKSLNDLKGLCTPGSQITGRTKTLESALGKLVRKPKYQSADKLQDGTGMRVICKNIADVQENVKRIRSKYKIVEEDDYISSDKDGYRSHHLTIEDADGLQKEVQVRTPHQNTWADWCHDIYKPVTKEQAAVLEKAKTEIAVYGKTMSEYFFALDSGKQPPPKPPCPPPVKQYFGCL